MPLDVLMLGGTGEIYLACAQRALQQGHRVTTFNRGNSQPAAGSRVIRGDIHDTDHLRNTAARGFDVVCQFLCFNETDAVRDIEVFGGQCEQYIFISSASAYQKPWLDGVLTEDVPLHNPFMSYSRDKARCEEVLLRASESGELPVTVVRPSHTYRERLPSTIVNGDHLLWRLLKQKPVLVHDSGRTLWTLTHAEDFAHAFTQLFRHPGSIGEAYHITDSTAHTWRTIMMTIAAITASVTASTTVTATTTIQPRPLPCWTHHFWTTWMIWIWTTPT